jgi:hypothetical protein
MPCACRVPVPEYPATAEWGPIVWSILHGLAEKAQRAVLPADELREWPKLIKLTSEMLPCDICRQHMVEYIKENPLREVPYYELRETVRRWFFTLHNEINAGNGKPLFSYDDLSAAYNSVNLQDMFWRLDPVIKKAIQVNGVGSIKYMNWIKSAKMMRAILQL